MHQLFEFQEHEHVVVGQLAAALVREDDVERGLCARQTDKVPDGAPLERGVGVQDPGYGFLDAGVLLQVVVEFEVADRGCVHGRWEAGVVAFGAAVVDFEGVVGGWLRHGG